MQGVVWKAPGEVSVETVADPSIVHPGDAVVRVTKAGICGSDMHPYHHGEQFGFSPGSRLGHEFVGVVEEVGPEVQSVRPGDKVASPFWISCGQCWFCRNEIYTSCIRGGAYGFEPFWPTAVGGPVQGGQSEYVRVPMADGTLEIVPESLRGEEDDARILPLTDVFATAWHAARLAGVTPGDDVLVIGDGAVGLLGVQVSALFGAARIVLAGHHDDRLAAGRRMGATHVVNTGSGGDLPGDLREATEGRGPDVVLATISNAETMRAACEAVRPGGAVGWVGMEVFLGPVDISWDVIFLKNISIQGGVAPVRRYLRHFWPLLEQGRIDPSPVLTHDLPLAEGARGYEIMATRVEGSVKVALTP